MPRDAPSRSRAGFQEMKEEGGAGAGVTGPAPAAATAAAATVPPATSPAPAAQKTRKNLDYVGGLRTLATLWIVMGHFMAMPRAMFDALLFRGTVPVQYYIILSGFITHYACNILFSFTPQYVRAIQRSLPSLPSMIFCLCADQ